MPFPEGLARGRDQPQLSETFRGTFEASVGIPVLGGRGRWNPTGNQKEKKAVIFPTLITLPNYIVLQMLPQVVQSLI